MSMAMAACKRNWTCILDDFYQNPSMLGPIMNIREIGLILLLNLPGIFLNLACFLGF